VVKYHSSITLFAFCLFALAPASVVADRYEASFEIVSSIGLSFSVKESLNDASQCSPEFQTGNSVNTRCSVLFLSFRDLSQHEATLLVDGAESFDWRRSGVSEGNLDLAFADEISLVLQ
jgi:hypothetical protein